MWIDCCSLEIDLCPMTKKKKKKGEKKKKNDKKENSNKQINGTRCTHTYIYTNIISTMTADSGNEANNNSFIVLLSDISGFRVNDSLKL